MCGQVLLLPDRLENTLNITLEMQFYENMLECL